MNRRGLSIDEFQRLGDIVQSPFEAFFRQRLPSYGPFQRRDALSGNIN